MSTRVAASMPRMHRYSAHMQTCICPGRAKIAPHMQTHPNTRENMKTTKVCETMPHKNAANAAKMLQTHIHRLQTIWCCRKSHKNGVKLEEDLSTPISRKTKTKPH